jgi:cell division septation protein DedD
VSELDIPHKQEVSPLLNSTLIADKNNDALSPAELNATNPSTEDTENFTDDSPKSSNELDADTPSTAPDVAVQEQESPPPVKKKIPKKEHKKARPTEESKVASVEKKTKDEPKPVKQKQAKPAEKVVAEKKLSKPKAEPEKVVKAKEPKPVEQAAALKKPVKAKAELPVLDSTYQEKSTVASAPKLNSSSTAENRRWVVQVASLSDQTKAAAFRDKLRSQGFPATIDSVWLNGKGRVYRLKVGPELNAEKAQAMKAKINQLNNVNSIAVAE